MSPAPNLGANSSKETIYIDVEDEITSIIEKVNASKSKIIALVLPKRATVFQSLVNMKLLKRSAEQAKKNLVLITTEAALMPLAASAGLYVASTPSSKPEIPSVGTLDNNGEEAINLDDESPAEVTAANSGTVPVGKLAGGAGAAAAADGIETVELDDESEDGDDTAETGAAAGATAATTQAKIKKDKKLKVPNFNKFRALVFLGVFALVLLVFGLYVAAAVLPKATITIGTDASDVNVDIAAELDTKATELDEAQHTIPAKSVQEQKTVSQQVAATGQKNNGDKATGTVNMSVPCSAVSSGPITIPAGTGVSAKGKTYITQDTVSLGSSAPSFSGGCHFNDSSDITAQTGGSQYNTDGSVDFSVAGNSNVSATGSADGGTDNIITVVQQSDIDDATKKMATQDTASVKDDLEKKITQDGLYPITSTFDTGTPTTTSSSQPGDQASNVTVTSVYTYSMYGAQKTDLEKLLKNDIKSQVDTSKQAILSTGLDTASFKVVGGADTSKQISIQSTGTVGPDLDATQIAKDAAGKKAGEVEANVNKLPGVTNVDVKTSPFWVNAVPKKVSKITVVIEKASNTAKHD